ncbi:MAG TPA: UGSC family (seleno)protein, partial [Stellaceae bacterium]|nr:UGSC family (seleno)protein [Stellaceae bacterium]
SCCTHDGIALEALGLPAAVIVTMEFLHEAEVQRAALGMPDLIPVVIDHPLSTISEAEIDARAAMAAERAVQIWQGKGR